MGEQIESGGRVYDLEDVGNGNCMATVEGLFREAPQWVIDGWMSALHQRLSDKRQIEAVTEEARVLSSAG